ncbi:ubiquitin domain-containing protein DSK2a-like isoform X2 [Olea europaea var. sylvestris]|uniref:ubiquitin domain-containing protein DSK2a-like isoform X2 n=1 Tax=Olea europaea var. sylvestris TaxID=158386 RepID=UPI000C1CE3C8|nr:ubiquitin domain-containing protein DSK2a-like isoform X2 [Olea europaea var. sylvestris]
MGGGDANDGGDSNENAGSKGGEVVVNVRCSNGSEFSVHVNLDSTVESFKSILAQNCEIPPQQQRLIYKGRILKDDQTLQRYGLEAEHTVHLVRGFATNASTNSAGATNAGNPHANPAVTADAGSNEGGAFGGSGFGASLFPRLDLNGLGSGAGLFGAGLPDMEHVQAQLTQNPNMMRDILNMPLVQNIMNNPEIIRNLIMNNPQMREIMDRNPELAHVLNDPATLRQTMEAARNPELMREMMRNTDRAMSNIESSPEGFNMLRRLYENVQEPFLNATTLEGGTRTDLGSNPFAALLGAQGGGVAREQVTNTSTTGSETLTDSPAPNTNPLPNPWASTGTEGVQTNSTAQSNPSGDVRTPPLGVSGGLGFPDFSQLLGSMPDPNSLSQLMQNPAISQMMQSLLSNPQYINQIIGFNPELQNMFNSNPQFRDMMQNPEFIRQLFSPGMMQRLLTFQQALLSQLGRQQTSREPGQNDGGTGAPGNLSLDILMNMFGGLGTGGLTASNRSNVPPEELYATQLSQLQEMGFIDTQENIRALIASAGNVHAAVERLLGNPGQ